MEHEQAQEHRTSVHTGEASQAAGDAVEELRSALSKADVPLLPSPIADRPSPGGAAMVELGGAPAITVSVLEQWILERIR